jgi:predicted HAD superfamily Cof-like phosphohydrolase
MSTNWFKDMQVMHKKYGVDEWMKKEKNSDWSRLNKFMNFRIKMMQEELDETKAAFKNKDQEEMVDGIIDMCVFAIGTLEVFGVDANKAWDEVLKANMSKEVGIKEGRPNPLGLPDLVKPEGWEGPTHKGNHGNITDSF